MLIRNPTRSTLLLQILSLSLSCTFTLNANAKSKADPELALSDLSATVGSKVQFVVNPTDRDGVVPSVHLKSGPSDSQLEDNLDGTRTFNWDANKLGTHELTFTIIDGQDDQVSKDIIMAINVEKIDAIKKQILVSVGESNINKISSADGIFVIGKNHGDVEKILSNVPVSKAQDSIQQTPLDIADGWVYITNMEIGSSGDGRRLPQKTVLRQGVQKSDGSWIWTAATIDDRTIYDKWHTAPSVGVDKNGYVHVAYNMHNMPWQYQRSVKPHQIDSFDFLGQSMTEEQRNKVVNDNNIDFPTLGTAAIPGNQVTYPAFYKDRNEDLFISYRFAATPKRRFSERTMSAGIAAYDVDSGQWTSSGGNIPLSGDDYEFNDEAGTSAIALAGQRGWTAYHPRLVFDNNNQMLVNWFWRPGTGGSRLFRPCMVISPDRKRQFYTLEGKQVSAPVSPDACGNMGFSDEKPFFTLGTTTIDANNVPYVLLSPEGESRQIVHYDRASNQWRREDAPNGATEIFFDHDNTLWAISSGIRIFKREQGIQDWKKVYDESDGNNCYPSVKLDESGSNAFIHTQACNGTSVTVYGLRLK